MRIAGIEHDSIVDGPGLRVSVFTQGCTHGCPGCHNPESHALNGGREMPVEEIIAQLGRSPLTTGVTLSGGDPMLQPEDCLAIAKAAHEKGLNVWTYTGYTWEELWQEENPARLALVRESDVLVDGRFIEGLKSYAAYFRGSTNQRLIDVKRTLQTGSIVTVEQLKTLEHFKRPES